MKVRVWECVESNELDVSDAMAAFEALRRRLERGFSAETAHEGRFNPRLPSRGQCAAVALIVQARYGGSLVTAKVEGRTHWFNRLWITVHTAHGPCQAMYDVDLTADQFWGGPPVWLARDGTLWRRARARRTPKGRCDSIRRAILLAGRANLEGERARLLEAYQR